MEQQSGDQKWNIGANDLAAIQAARLCIFGAMPLTFTASME